MRNSTIVHIFLALGLFACGSSTNAPNAAEFGQVASSISTTASTHRTAMASVASMADCQTERDRYGAQVSPLLDRMQAMSGDMDGCMASMGHANAVSMAATCTSMRGELDRHMNVACASSDLTHNSSEAAVHADRMIGWANTASSEAGDMQRMMGGSGMMGSGSCHM